MLAISSRNSEAAVLNLLEKTGSKLLLANIKYERFAKSVIGNISDIDLVAISAFDVDALSKEPLTAGHEQILNMEFTDQDTLKPALIVHSSGSTAFPKPISLSSRYLFYVINNLEVPLTDSKLERLTDKDVMLALTPFVHVFGILGFFSVTIHGGSAVMFEQLPVPQKEIVDALLACNVTLLAAPPLVYEQMADHFKETNLCAAERIKYAVVGGASFKQEILDWYHSQQVNLCVLYGTTEACVVMTSNLDPDCKNRNSLHFIHKDTEGHVYGTFETNDESEPHIKHLYMHADSPTLASHVANRPEGGYDTQDLFIEHLDFSGTYTYFGRRDDILIMENGEKTNPVPMEAAIRQHPMVQQVTVIGHGRQCTATLILLNKEHAECFDPEEIIAAVHAAVNKANLECPGHSKIFPQMVKILPFNQTLPTTDKGTVMRKKAESAYQDVVKRLYKEFLEGTSSGTKTNSGYDTSAWTPEQTEDFLVTCASEVLDVPETAFKDRARSIFELGLNSLAAIQLRNRIAEYFDSIPQNFLYQHSTIVSMRQALLSGQQQDPSE
ncbi:Origin recognition complex subunit 2 [Mucor velutinosus]|uniref:Origin recognition complex subunit 2 n=1 Tax=Mucor velutinosus TaxID=708070 RepID=A0AAN7D4H5_9FUNG|nr:Origin recognition complex subunit 2 [Mucor velutinosus]